ncbi:MAG: IS1595 family transposase [Marinifilaceae bacterium]|jgi:transposase-like protein|nr:IS1595 family transposase [Marinifilaceae bacterium]
MKRNLFNKILSKISDLSNLEFRLLKEKIQQREYKKRVSNILETELSKLKCPFCDSKYFIKWGKRSDLQRYRCKGCNKTFNSLTKTPLAKLKRKGHWLDYAECIKDGMTLAKSAEICDIHINTAFRWRHRFLSNMKEIKAKKIGGVVESGHLTLKESFKGSRTALFNSKQERKKVYVIYGLDRNNNIFDITNKGLSLSLISNEFKNILLNKSLIFSSKDPVYSDFAKTNNYFHRFLSNDKKRLTSSLMLENYRAEFNEWICKHFRGVATKYLETYVSWFRSLKEFRTGISALTILYRAKSVEKYRHQPEKVKKFVFAS